MTESGNNAAAPDVSAPPAVPETRRMDCDVLVVGAGPAGLAAACAAAESGARVVVLDQSPWTGGQIWRGEESAPGGSQQRAWRRRFRESGARLCLRTTALAAPRRMWYEPCETWSPGITYAVGNEAYRAGALADVTTASSWSASVGIKLRLSDSVRLRLSLEHVNRIGAYQMNTAFSAVTYCR